MRGRSLSGHLQRGSVDLKVMVENATSAGKMHIETAAELTRNNRVASAEMLGLFRQSPYEKLRWFDLLSRDS